MKRIGLGVALALAIFVGSAAAQQFNQPAPAVVGGPVGSPTYVMPPDNSVIDVGQAFGALAPFINSAVGVIITAGLGWLGTLLHKKFNIDIDAGARDALTTFLQRQASSLVADGAVKLNGLQVEVHNPSLAKAANEAITAIPGTLKRFGITPEKVSSVIGDMIVDYVHHVPAVASVAAASAPTPAAVKA